MYSAEQEHTFLANPLDTERMGPLVVGRFQEQVGYLLVPLFGRHTGVERIAIPGLGFTGECLHKVLFCLRAFHVHARILLSSSSPLIPFLGPSLCGTGAVRMLPAPRPCLTGQVRSPTDRRNSLTGKDPLQEAGHAR